MTKVFVSSKQGELDPEREALHAGLKSLGYDVFAIEYSGASPDSVRDVFLKHVAECDVYLGIFAGIYSQPTVDEYHKAKEFRKPILIYIKKCAHEPPLENFIRAELQPSHKYQEFSTTEELVSHLPDIRRALEAEVQKHQRQAYLDALVVQTELLELAGIVDSGEQERSKLQEIFVALSAAEEVEERNERQPKDKRERERPVKITRRVTIDQALREHRNLMILGDPGAGKSTLLRYLTLVAATTTADNRPQTADPSTSASLSSASAQDGGGLSSAVGGLALGLPILIRLSSFARSGQSLVEYFETYAKTQLHVSLGEKFFERALEDGQAIVCLDGLDEVSQPAQRINVRNALTALAARYPRNRFIVTSRVAGYDSASLDKRAFAHHTIVPFGEKEIQSFAEKWYAAREREPEQAKTRAANLFNDLKANERLLKLAENPLTLTIIALVHQRAQGKLPDVRVELYDRCAETLIEEWDKWKGLAPEDRARPHYQLRRRLLERAAYWMHIESGRGGVTPSLQKRALEMKVAEFLVEDKTLNLSEDTARIEAKQFVALATSRTGILVEREQGAVSFIHLTFQEYFAASDLYWRCRKSPKALWRAIQPYLYDSRWLEVILLLLGRLNDDGDTPSIIVEKILREHDKFDDVIHRDLFLAARCLADGVKVRETLRNEIVDTLLKFASDEYPKYNSLQNGAIHALGTLRDNKRAGECLLALAQDPQVNYSTRANAAYALGQLGRMDDVVIQGLLTLAQDEQANKFVRRAAAQTLGRLGRTDDTVIQDILASLPQPPTPPVGGGLSPRLLEPIKEDSVASIPHYLASAQDTKENVWVRHGAVYALEQFARTDDAVIQGLLALAQDVKDHALVRSAAAQVLGRTDDAAQLLLPLVQDPEENVNMRIEATEILGEMECTDDVVIQGLLALAQDVETDAKVRYAAMRALGYLGRAGDAVRLFFALARDTTVNWYVRRAAMEALGDVGFIDDAVHLLLASAQDAKVDSDVRRDATRALERLGRIEPRVALAFLELTIDKNDLIRNDAYRALEEMVGNLRYAELDNGQKRIKRTGRKTAGRKQKAVSSKRKNEIPLSARNDKRKIRIHKSQIRNGAQ